MTKGKNSADKKKRRFGRARYNADYAPDSGGEYHYIGSMFRVDVTGKARQTLRMRLIATAALSIAAFACGGASNGETGRAFYALIPFICCMMPLFYFAMGLFKFLVHKGDFTNKGMDESFGHMKHSAVGLIVCAAMAIVGGTVVCLLTKTLVNEIMFLLSSWVMLACAIAQHVMLKRVTIREIRRQ